MRKPFRLNSRWMGRGTGTRIVKAWGRVMKVLVVFATKTGCTKEIAERIGTTLKEVADEVEVRSADEDPGPGRFDAVVLGSGVRAGHWHKSASKWLQRHASTLAQKRVALFTCCLTMATSPEKAQEVRAYTQPLIDAAGLHPVDVGLLAGWFQPEHFGFLERTILKAMKSPQGDFRDFQAVDAWARRVAPALGLSLPEESGGASV